MSWMILNIDGDDGEEMPGSVTSYKRDEGSKKPLVCYGNSKSTPET